MNCLRIIISILFLMINFTYPSQSSSESVNPFNEYMSLNGDVNLFIGTATYSLPLVTFSTKGTNALSIGLEYSSNVDINARADNEVAHTGWVGLGWSLGFGKIVCNHNGTMTDADDDYMWISQEGVGNQVE